MTTAIPEWTPPWDSRGSQDLIRVSASHLSGRGCREQQAKKARPALFPAEYLPYIPRPVAEFPLGAVQRAAVRLLRDPASAAIDPDTAIAAAIAHALAGETEPWPDDSTALLARALSGYLAVLTDLAASGDLPASLAFTDAVLAEEGGSTRVEFTAWGLHHYADGGTIRETHILRLTNAPGVTLSQASVAVAAATLSAGYLAQPKEKPKDWQDPFAPLTGFDKPKPAQLVRVRVIGMTDATHDIRFEGTPEETQSLFDETVPPALSVYAGGAYHPSRFCSSCSIRQHCPALTRLPGLLGVAGYSEPTRSLTPSDLRIHEVCPRQLHLTKDLGVPSTRTVTPHALRRGSQIHAWLENAHRRGHACTLVDLPDPDMTQSAGETARNAGIATDLGWTSEEYATNRLFVLQHLHQCPHNSAEHDTLRPEYSITAWDTDANVVVSTRPDVAYVASVDGATVLRETKTLDPRRVPPDTYRQLEAFPQVALAICLLADGHGLLDGAEPRPSRVELELIGATAHEVVTYDVGDPKTLLMARTALAERVDRWLFDITHPVGSNPYCTTCPVSEACGRGAQVDVDPTTVDYLHGINPDALLADWQDSSAAAVSAAIGENDSDEVEEFPF